MNKKVTHIHFESTHFTGGSENSGQRYIISIQDLDINVEPEFYTGSSFDKSISGRLRQNLRGMRVFIELSYQRSVESGKIRNLINDIIVAFVTNNADSITFYPDASQANNFEVVLDASSYSQQYNNTINSFSPSISLVSLDEITTIPVYLQAP